MRFECCSVTTRSITSSKCKYSNHSAIIICSMLHVPNRGKENNIYREWLFGDEYTQAEVECILWRTVKMCANEVIRVVLLPFDRVDIVDNFNCIEAIANDWSTLNVSPCLCYFFHHCFEGMHSIWNWLCKYSTQFANEMQLAERNIARSVRNSERAMYMRHNCNKIPSKVEKSN